MKRTSYNNKWTQYLRKEGDVPFLENDQRICSLTADLLVGVEDIEGSQVLAELFARLFPDVGNRARASTLNALKVALYALRGLANDGITFYGIVAPESNTAPRLPDRYKAKNGVTRQSLAKVLKVMSDSGWLIRFKGKKGKDHPTGLASLFLVTPLLTSWLETNQHALRVVRLPSHEELLILKDGDAESAKLCEYSDDISTQAMRERIARTNKLRNKFTWTYHQMASDGTYWDGMDRTLIEPVELECRRIFSRGSFDIGGRFYCAAQLYRSDERTTIQIDGEATLEIDYKSHHPNMMYHYLKLEAPEDCYSVPRHELPTSVAELPETKRRNLLKKVFMCCANAKSQEAATLALTGGRWSLSYKDASVTLKAYERQHEAISELFYKSAWEWLQALDSRLTDSIMSVMAGNGIPVLPIHDSYLVRTRDAETLRNVMFDVYKAELGFEPRVSYGKAIPEHDELIEELLGRANGRDASQTVVVD